MKERIWPWGWFQHCYGITIESNVDPLWAHFIKSIYHEKFQKKIEKWFQSQVGDVKWWRISEGTRFILTPLCFRFNEREGKWNLFLRYHTGAAFLLVYFLDWQAVWCRRYLIWENRITHLFTHFLCAAVGSKIKRICMNTLGYDKQRIKIELDLVTKWGTQFTGGIYCVGHYMKSNLESNWIKVQMSFGYRIKPQAYFSRHFGHPIPSSAFRKKSNTFLQRCLLFRSTKSTENYKRGIYKENTKSVNKNWWEPSLFLLGRGWCKLRREITNWTLEKGIRRRKEEKVPCFTLNLCRSSGDLYSSNSGSSDWGENLFDLIKLLTGFPPICN